MPISLTPAPGYALVQMGEKYKNIKVPTRAYESKANGILMSTRRYGKPADLSELNAFDNSNIGKRVFWEEHVAGAPITRDGVDYAFIKLEAIQGYEEVEGAE